MLCYSKVCGFENDMYGMSKYLIKYFDETHDTYDKECRQMSAKEYMRYRLLIDSEQRRIVEAHYLNKMIIIGKWGILGQVQFM